MTPIIKKTKYSSTHLEEAYWLAAPPSSPARWSETAMMRVIGAKGLNLDYYRNHPEAQTVDTWKYIERIYEFFCEQQRIGRRLLGKSARWSFF
ncbi:hypothetical protein ACFTAO_20795 [Paenibacillus rhizoplanae]